MSCSSESKTGAKGSGGCCGGCQPFPWFSVLTDPAIARLFLLRYRRELLLGLAAGCLSGLAILGWGDALSGLGPLLHGPWLHWHAAAILPTTLLSGLLLALGVSPQNLRGWASSTLRVLGCAVLGGIANGLLEVPLGAFLPEGALAYGPAAVFLCVPAAWLAWALLTLPFGKTR